MCRCCGEKLGQGPAVLELLNPREKMAKGNSITDLLIRVVSTGRRKFSPMGAVTLRSSTGRSG